MRSCLRQRQKCFSTKASRSPDSPENNWVEIFNISGSENSCVTDGLLDGFDYVLDGADWLLDLSFTVNFCTRSTVKEAAV